jgi:hypothetical protein
MLSTLVPFPRFVKHFAAFAEFAAFLGKEKGDIRQLSPGR